MINLKIETQFKDSWSKSEAVEVGTVGKDGDFSAIFVIENLGKGEVRLQTSNPTWSVVRSLTDDKLESFVLSRFLTDKPYKLAQNFVQNISSYVDCEATAVPSASCVYLNIPDDLESRIAFAEKLLPVYQKILNELVSATVPENPALATETIASIKQFGFDFGKDLSPYSNMLVYTSDTHPTEPVHIDIEFPTILNIQMEKKSSERDQLWSFATALGVSAKKSSYGWLTVKFGSYEETCVALETFAKKVEEIFANNLPKVAKTKKVSEVPVISQEAQKLLKSLIYRSDEIVSESADPEIYDTVESQVEAAIEELSESGTAANNPAAIELFTVLKGKKPVEADPVEDSTIMCAEISEKILTKLLKKYFLNDYRMIVATIANSCQ